MIAWLTESDPFLRRLAALHRELGLPADYVAECRLPLCREPQDLVDTEADAFGRPQRLTAEAFSAWREMKSAAAADGIDLLLVSAFRGLDYQQELIAAKLRQGRNLEAILKVNAAPGYSEHHTGRAIDIGTPGCVNLEEVFADTAAFGWLEQNAGRFRFRLSYPEDNALGIAYEPWHWCYHSQV